ncbi:hypothetical protein HAX54_010750, partial [Datura stramonium]|nr:hypothetical protein [Datura stramonium]
NWRSADAHSRNVTPSQCSFHSGPVGFCIQAGVSPTPSGGIFRSHPVKFQSSSLIPWICP